MERREADGACVLVVDDEGATRAVLCEIVNLLGCVAQTASNGAEALAFLETHRPCLIILDLAMPVMSGEELLDAMRSQPDLAAIPIVISTSNPDRAPSGVPFLTKPLTIAAVSRSIRGYCPCATAPLP